MKLSAFFLFALLTCHFSYAQSFSTFAADFTKTSRDSSGTTEISGKIYFKLPDSALIFVENPLKQWLKYSNNDLIIYYPEEDKAYKLVNENPAAVPLISSFISVIKEDFGLSDLGFSMSEASVVDDSIFVYWNPPEALKTYISRVELLYLGDKLLATKTLDQSGSIISSNSYKNHIKHKAYHIPLQISSYQKTANTETWEEIAYTQPEFEIDYQKAATPFERIEKSLLLKTE